MRGMTNVAQQGSLAGAGESAAQKFKLSCSDKWIIGPPEWP